MLGREEMLDRIRKALGRPLEAPGAKLMGVKYPLDTLADLLPAIAPEDLLAKFEAELLKVGGAAYRVATRQALEEALRKLLGSFESPQVVLSRNPLLKLLGLEEMLRGCVASVEAWPDALVAPSGGNTNGGLVEFASASFQASVGITGADFALAETGSLVVTSATEGSQLVSLAPPVHIALYRRSQLVGSLDEVLTRLPVPHSQEEPLPGRSVVFITGTSRTADIEQILIRGVHGPREVHAILVEESCLA
jgi:L-lactate dehydrogenase complex protein LldG